MTDVIEPGGKWPICTDGGAMSHSHTGSSQMLQKIVQSVRQVRGTAPVYQAKDCHTSICCGSGGAGSLQLSMLIVGDERA
jgi:acetyl-CoA acetyltransferase